ncbi:MAG: hypothetical protein ACP5KB_02250 [Thermoprotei archaeon]
MSEYPLEIQRGWIAGFYRASKYLVVATLLESIMIFSFLWWLIVVYLRFFLSNGPNFVDVSKELSLLSLSPQTQLIMLGSVISSLLWLYAVFGEMVPSLRELEVQGVSLGSSPTMIVVGTIATLTQVAIQVTILSIAYLILTDIVILMITYLLALGTLVTYLLAHVGFFLVLDKLGHVLSNKRFVVAGVLVLVSAFIFFLGPVAWFISFMTARNLLKTTA